MKIALLGDIHGNHLALDAVLNSIASKGIQILVITGDFVGYYYWPKKVFELLANWNVVAVRGNHDRMLLTASDDPSFLEKVNRRYGSGLKIAVEQLDEKRIKWFADLPDSLRYPSPDGDIFLCHGSPWDKDEYIYPDAEKPSLSRYLGLKARWVIQGHTHYPMHLKYESLSIINPGSVGQARGNGVGAQWALLDTENAEVEFFSESYDPRKIIRESELRDSDQPYLANVLRKSL